MISSHILKLQGKAELPAEIALGHNYHVALEGSIVTVAESDNEDGTNRRVYTFRPVKIDLLTDKGEMLKLKDTRSNSQLVRAMLYKKWVNAASQESFDDFYRRFSYLIMADMDVLIDKMGEPE